MTIRPRATSSRTSSGARASRWATKRMASVTTPARAYSSCVEQVGVAIGVDSVERKRAVRGRAEAEADVSVVRALPGPRITAAGQEGLLSDRGETRRGHP